MQQTSSTPVQLTSVNADVVMIRGAPAAGKSQTAKALTLFFPRGVKVEVDTLRKMVVSVDWKNQEEHINLLRVAARLTHDFVKLGFSPVIVVDTFSGNKFDLFINALLLLDSSFKVKLFGLYVSDEVLRIRLEARSCDEFKDFVICKKLNEDVLRIKHASEFQIDTTRRSSMQTAEMVYKRLISVEPV